MGASHINAFVSSDGTGRDTYLLLDPGHKKGKIEVRDNWFSRLRETPSGHHMKGYGKWYTATDRPRQFSPPCLSTMRKTQDSPGKLLAQRTYSSPKFSRS